VNEIECEEIKKRLASQHEGDEKQLEVVFSDKRRLIVEAPAGYGKTTTMISRIAYLYATDRIPNPKRILGLTFSVNAALKVKRDVAAKLPGLINIKNSPASISDKVVITNYHGFCKMILRKYGYLISDILRKDVNLFKAISDSDIRKQVKFKNAISSDELEYLEMIDNKIKSTEMPNDSEINSYNEIVIKKLIPVEYITHNAVILLVIELFKNKKEIANFYQNYFQLILVDEFQDTNSIAWMLLNIVISENTQLLFLGDSLQRIYGFIGALPNIIETATDQYEMTKILLEKNYRFKDNYEMLKLDKNIRANANNYFKPNIDENEIAKLPIFWGKSQVEEATKVVTKMKELINDADSKIAILFHSRCDNVNIFEEQLEKNHVPYFYGMFTDEDDTYIDFHHKCEEIFINQFSKSKMCTQKSLKKFSDSVKKFYLKFNDQTIHSLLVLLDALIEKVGIDYSDLSSEEKFDLIKDIFENNQLKQAMEYVDSKVILSTVHGAKGLEWEYVVVYDIQPWVYTFCCKTCPSLNINNGYACTLPENIPENIVETLVDDLCVFYVALTRAKKQVFITASAERYNSSGRLFSNSKAACFAFVEGIKLTNATTFKDFQ
jgi:DNA helicase-2/ATP-dependent DNA helicase PcrA